ncbi:polysaccharide deacetylase [Caproiciproducens galactitolivorans]|uniref:Polysaccharide deacetylase n=1 Tax=Caproiciproducens galactitolivorans TaxID=642589 RepID=A0ABT4BPX9_9FIRM|nr:polysaccharide deacetylase [Caproiciproducens galactitolivorans]
MIVSAAFLLLFALGMLIGQFSGKMGLFHAAKPTMAAAGMPTNGNVQSTPQPAESEAASSASSSTASSAEKEAVPAYQAMYPHLYAGTLEPSAPVKKKTVYLTFDDGPSNLTVPLLNVLDTYHVKATFFVIGRTDRQSVEAIKEIVNRGHAIGVHSYTHQYKQIYASPAAFLDDFAKMHDLIENTTGVDTKIYRYAGGSVNGYNKSTARDIIAEMNRRRYVYYDWNVDSGDAETGATAKSIYREVINGVHRHSDSVVLFHNTKFKASTLNDMSKIIKTLQSQGYSFEKLDPSVDSVSYRFNNIP